MKPDFKTVLKCRPFSLLCAVVFIFTSCGPKNKPARPEIKDITQAVYASGKVYPADYYRVTSSLPGYLDKVFVRVGDTVQAGDPLFSIKNEVSDFNVESSRITAEAARKNASSSSPVLAAARDELDAAKARFILDSVNYSRYSNLQAAGAGTRQALDQARTQFQTSKANLARAKANLEATRIRVSTELANANTALKAQTTSKNNFTVQSTIAGMVYDQEPRPGEFVGPQTVVVEVGKLNAMEVELAIDETDINFIKPGQQVVYGADAFGEQVVKGVIKEVYPKISPLNKTIKAIASINLPAGLTLYAGSTLEANIVYAQKKGAMVLPRTYVSGDSVTVRRKGKYVKQRVKTGLQDVQFIEIVSGLDSTTDVYRP